MRRLERVVRGARVRRKVGMTGRVRMRGRRQVMLKPIDILTGPSGETEPF